MSVGYRDHYLGGLRIGSTELRLHASLVLLVVGLLGLGLATGKWHVILALFLGWASVVAIHEAGHAALAHRFGQHVFEVRIHLFGGATLYRGQHTPLQKSVIAWGGFLTR